jgi:hypothetical protein
MLFTSRKALNKEMFDATDIQTHMARPHRW